MLEHCEKKLTAFWYEHSALYLLKKNISNDKDCNTTVNITSKKKNGCQAEPSKILIVGSKQTITIEKSLLMKTPELKKKECKKTMLMKNFLCVISVNRTVRTFL